MNKLNVTVTGTCRGNNFSDAVQFTLIPPKTQDYYGNGHYMTVEVNGDTTNAFYIDCRYAKTTNIEKLARIWIKDFYGDNAKEVKKTA